MATTRTTMADLGGVTRSVAGIDLRLRVRRGAHAARDTVLVVATLAILLLVAT